MANIEQLDRALKWIEENPKLHNQRVWGERTECGTAMCLFGAVAALNGYMLVDEDGKVPPIGTLSEWM